MFRWIMYILRGLTNLLGEPMYSTRCQVCDGEGRIDGDWCTVCQGKIWLRTEEQQQAARDWNAGKRPFLEPFSEDGS